MRWSNLLAPTLREAPADAVVASHQLLLRGGFIRQLHAGHYSLLPLGLRVHKKVAAIVREEMDAIGAQEMLLPALHPAWVWERSGRWQAMGDEMFRLQDRRGNDHALGMTHEEVVALLLGELRSYRDLPQIWYQIQTKFRDEPRPKSGLLRVREFAMKDSYSIDLHDEGLDQAFELHREAYQRIFRRLGLSAIAVEASSGAMGGSASVEFMVPSPAGEDDIAACANCGYAANVERATSAVKSPSDEPNLPLQCVPTPGIRTIADLAKSERTAAPYNQIKTLLVFLDDAMTLVLLRGDHELNVQKLLDDCSASSFRAATPEECLDDLEALPGSLGPVHVKHRTILADHALAGRRNLWAGANEDDYHYRGVDMERHIAPLRWGDFRQVNAGEPCAKCGEPLEVTRCIETGHIFKLGRRYAEAFDVSVLDENGDRQTPAMGSYGIGIGRAMAAIAETNHDDRGLIWPVSVAPFSAAVVSLAAHNSEVAQAAEKLYEELREAGADVLLDDRDLRAGVKFSDIELIGIPYRLTIGQRGLSSGVAELTERASGKTENVPIGEAAERLLAAATQADDKQLTEELGKPL